MTEKNQKSQKNWKNEPIDSWPNSILVNDIHQAYNTQHQANASLAGGSVSVEVDGKHYNLEEIRNGSIKHREYAWLELLTRLAHYDELRQAKNFKQFKQILKARPNLLKKQEEEDKEKAQVINRAVN